MGPPHDPSARVQVEPVQEAPFIGIFDIFPGHAFIQRHFIVLVRFQSVTFPIIRKRVFCISSSTGPGVGRRLQHLGSDPRHPLLSRRRGRAIHWGSVEVHRLSPPGLTG